MLRTLMRRKGKVESTQTMIRIVGLSAPLPNYLEVAQFLRVNQEIGLFFVSSYRPVPQYIGISEPNSAACNDLLNEKVVDSLRQGHQAMVFVHSRKDTAETAEKLVELARKYEDLELLRKDTHPQLALIKKEVVKSKNKDLVGLFEFAFGFHHAGMLHADRGLTERFFSDGLLKGTQLYDPKAGGWRDLGMLDVMQARPKISLEGLGDLSLTKVVKAS